MTENNTHSHLIDISLNDSDLEKNSIQNKHNSLPHLQLDNIKSNLQMEISKSLQTWAKTFYRLSQRGSVRQIQLEIDCTNILKRLIDLYNSRYLRNFQYRLIKEVYED